MLLYVFVKGERGKKNKLLDGNNSASNIYKDFSTARPPTKWFGPVFVKWIVDKWYCHPNIKNLAYKVLLSALVAIGLVEVMLLWIIFCDGHVQAKDELTTAFRRLLSHV